MVLISPVAEFHTLKQLIGYVRVASSSEERGKPVQAGENAVLNRVCQNVPGPAQDARHAETAFEDRAFALCERRGAPIGPGKELSAIVGGEDDDGVVVQAEILELLHHQADVVIELGHAGLLF